MDFNAIPQPRPRHYLQPHLNELRFYILIEGGLKPDSAPFDWHNLATVFDYLLLCMDIVLDGGVPSRLAISWLHQAFQRLIRFTNIPLHMINSPFTIDQLPHKWINQAPAVKGDLLQRRNVLLSASNRDFVPGDVWGAVSQPINLDDIFNQPYAPQPLIVNQPGVPADVIDLTGDDDALQTVAPGMAIPAAAEVTAPAFDITELIDLSDSPSSPSVPETSSSVASSRPLSGSESSDALSAANSTTTPPSSPEKKKRGSGKAPIPAGPPMPFSANVQVQRCTLGKHVKPWMLPGAVPDLHPRQQLGEPLDEAAPEPSKKGRGKRKAKKTKATVQPEPEAEGDVSALNDEKSGGDAVPAVTTTQTEQDDGDDLEAQLQAAFDEDYDVSPEADERVVEATDSGELILENPEACTSPCRKRKRDEVEECNAVPQMPFSLREFAKRQKVDAAVSEPLTEDLMEEEAQEAGDEAKETDSLFGEGADDEMVEESSEGDAEQEEDNLEAQLQAEVDREEVQPAEQPAPDKHPLIAEEVERMGLPAYRVGLPAYRVGMYEDEESEEE